VSIGPDTEARLRTAKEKIWQDHRKDPNFTGCGIGYRRRGGAVTDEPVVIAMVTDKLPAGALSRRRLLPAGMKVDGVSYGVDVVEVGPVFASAGAARSRPDAIETTGPITGKFTPPKQGVGISNINAPSSDDGTIGCFVFDLTDYCATWKRPSSARTRSSTCPPPR
jgi:hypothetical protein